MEATYVVQIKAAGKWQTVYQGLDEIKARAVLSAAAKEAGSINTRAISSAGKDSDGKTRWQIAEFDQGQTKSPSAANNNIATHLRLQNAFQTIIQGISTKTKIIGGGAATLVLGLPIALAVFSDADNSTKSDILTQNELVSAIPSIEAPNRFEDALSDAKQLAERYEQRPISSQISDLKHQLTCAKNEERKRANTVRSSVAESSFFKCDTDKQFSADELEQQIDAKAQAARDEAYFLKYAAPDVRKFNQQYNNYLHLSKNENARLDAASKLAELKEQIFAVAQRLAAFSTMAANHSSNIEILDRVQKQIADAKLSTHMNLAQDYQQRYNSIYSEPAGGNVIAQSKKSEVYSLELRSFALKVEDNYQYALALRENTYSSLEGYLNSHPEGEYRNEIASILNARRLADNALYNQIQHHTILINLEKYLEQFPDGIHHSKVSDLINPTTDLQVFKLPEIYKPNNFARIIAVKPDESNIRIVSLASEDSNRNLSVSKLGTDGKVIEYKEIVPFGSWKASDAFAISDSQLVLSGRGQQLDDQPVRWKSSLFLRSMIDGKPINFRNDDPYIARLTQAVNSRASVALGQQEDPALIAAYNEAVALQRTNFTTNTLSNMDLFHVIDLDTQEGVSASVDVLTCCGMNDPATELTVASDDKGGYFVAGIRSNRGNYENGTPEGVYQHLISHLDKKGKVIWTSFIQAAPGIAFRNQGIAKGATESATIASTVRDVKKSENLATLITHFNEKGETQWKLTLDYMDVVHISEDSMGSLVLIANKEFQGWRVKVSTGGELIEQAQLTEKERFWGLVKISDDEWGGVLDNGVAKLNSNYELIWKKKVDGAALSFLSVTNDHDWVIIRANTDKSGYTISRFKENEVLD